MKTLALIAQKGGTGKTTLALSLAVVAVRDGLNVAVIDLDPQTSAANWGDRRADGAPAVVCAPVGRLVQILDTARDNGADLAIIDTPGKSEQSSLAAARAADLVLIPTRPQIHDLETLPASKQIVELSGSTRAIAVLNAVSPYGRRHEEARAAIEQMGIEVCPAMVMQRAAFGDAPSNGQGVSEYEPGGKAAQEIEQVYKFIRQILNNQTTGDDHGSLKLAGRAVSNGPRQSRARAHAGK